jgi:Ala-tRNA(Pro) deacylase
MPVKKLVDYLDQNDIKYITINHSPAYTSREIASSTLVPRREFAKTVIVALDGELAMAVVPASRHVDLDALAALAGAKSVEIADEATFSQRFPDCAVGAMPPFGNLYDMKVYADSIIRDDDDIVFNAGTHTQVVRIACDDYLSLVNPVIGEISIKE